MDISLEITINGKEMINLLSFRLRSQKNEGFLALTLRSRDTEYFTQSSQRRRGFHAKFSRGAGGGAESSR